MNIAIRTDFCGDDMSRLAEYATKFGVRNIHSFPAAKECYNEAGYMELERLQQYRKGFDDRGLDLRMLSEIIPEEAVLFAETAERQAKILCRTIEMMAKTGIDTLFLFFDLPVSQDELVNEEKWKHLIQIYREVVPCAEEWKIRIANHGHQYSQYLIWNYEGMNRLLEAVPSDYNGVTFCMGCYQLAGDDIYELIHRFGKKIFCVHARDVVRRAGGFDEVIFGTGEVDVYRTLRELQRIGYDGLVCPEHLPKMSYEPYEEINIAWGLGYLHAALATLER